MQDNYLITGATGFIGSCITRELIRQKKHVSVIVRDKNLNWRLHDVASKLDIHECDLLSKSLDNVVSRILPTYIFHLATYGALPNETDINKIIDVDIRGTFNLINATKKHDFKLFINTGSSSEYGIKDKPMNETDVLEPINDYGMAKTAATLICQKEAIRNNLPIINFRLFSPYGYSEDKSRLIPSVILAALENKSIELSIPSNVRDFVFIEDVVSAYIKATENTNGLGNIYNIGSGKQHTVKEIIDIIIRQTSSKSIIKWGVIQKQNRQLEPKTWVANIQKIEKDLDWKPKYSLEEGLSKTIDWFKENYQLYE